MKRVLLNYHLTLIKTYLLYLHTTQQRIYDASFLKNDLDEIFNSLQIQNINNYYVLPWDLNSKHMEWGNTSNNSKGIKLKQWLADNEIYLRCNLYASTTPSHPRALSYLDICLVDCRLHLAKENCTINCIKTLNK